MSLNEAAHVLDNPGWYALNSHHAHFVINHGLAKRYPADVTGLVTVDEHSASGYADLAQIVSPGEVVGLFERQLPSEIPGWTIHQTIVAVQMVCERPVSEPEMRVTIESLSASDVPDMLHLIELTRPGPFLPRTIEMGHYIGIRQQDQLIAMAGERFYVPGYREISAVCTHPDHQGKGYARLLVSLLVNRNWQSGDVPFLHVMAQNTHAIKLYERLNFYKRCDMQAIVLSRIKTVDRAEKSPAQS